MTDPRSATRTRHLLDDLDSAVVRAPGPGHVGIQSITIARETRTSLFQHPTSEVTFRGIALGRSPALVLGCGLKQVCWDRVRSPVVFRVRARDARGRERTVFEATIDARAGGAGRRWTDARVDLARFAGATVDLTFETSVGKGGDASFAWAGWSDPRIEDLLPAGGPAPVAGPARGAGGGAGRRGPAGARGGAPRGGGVGPGGRRGWRGGGGPTGVSWGWWGRGARPGARARRGARASGTSSSSRRTRCGPTTWGAAGASAPARRTSTRSRRKGACSSTRGPSRR